MITVLIYLLPVSALALFCIYHVKKYINSEIEKRHPEEVFWQKYERKQREYEEEQRKMLHDGMYQYFLFLHEKDMLEYQKELEIEKVKDKFKNK